MSLRPELILDVARAADLAFAGAGPKHPLHCPLHDDEHPSAFLDSERNIFYCSRCSPDGGWSARRLAEALGVPWPVREPSKAYRLHRATPAATRTFTPAEARSLWRAALARARDDDAVAADAEVYAYLRQRQLILAFEDASFGIVAVGMPLPDGVAHWPRSGHRLVAPLFDAGGDLVNVQARCLRADRRKTLFPKGSSAEGAVFASRLGQRLLRGNWVGPPVVILGEGMTDSLALGLTAIVPVLAVPGAQYAAGAMGSWVQGINLYLALDQDKAGQDQVQPAADRAYRMGARNVAWLRWPAGCKDACDVLGARGADGLAEVLDQHTRGGSHG